MKKKYIFLFIILKLVLDFLLVNVVLIPIVLISLRAGGTGDWTYKLTNDYEVWKINSEDIVCGKINDGSFETIVPKYVSEFTYSNKYILVKRIDKDRRIFDNIYDKTPDYYIIDSLSDEILGPLTEEDFNNKINDYNINDIKWIKSFPDPKGAKYPFY